MQNHVEPVLPSSQQLLWQFPGHASRQVLGFLGTTAQIFDLGGPDGVSVSSALEVPVSTLRMSLARVAHAVGGVAKTNAPTFSGASKANPTLKPTLNSNVSTCLVSRASRAAYRLAAAPMDVPDRFF